jgi:hypothetical protein
VSFEPVTMYTLRCDGRLAHSQCPEVHHYVDPEDDSGDLIRTLLDKPELSEAWAKSIRSEGWMAFRDGRVHCAKHVKGTADMAEALAFGLPFEAAGPSQQEGEDR